VATADRLPADATMRWCRSARVVWRRTLDGVIVLPILEAAEPIALRGSAADIWDLLAEPMTSEDLIAVLAAAHGVSELSVAADVDGALVSLSELGALCRG
jgi:coenzyme PQQ synthesis protein D (PqqD)